MKGRGRLSVVLVWLEISLDNKGYFPIWPVSWYHHKMDEVPKVRY